MSTMRTTTNTTKANNNFDYNSRLRYRWMFVYIFCWLVSSVRSFSRSDVLVVGGSKRSSTQSILRKRSIISSSLDSYKDAKNYEHTYEEPQSSSSSSFYLATCIPGLSQILATELIELKCQNVLVESSSAVTFQADLSTALQVIVWTRTAHKVLELLCSTSSSTGTICNRDELHHFVKSNVDVKDLLGNGSGGLLNLSVSVTLNNPKFVPDDINHSHYTALTIKNALADAVRDLRGDRPNVELDNPDVPLVAIILGIKPEVIWKRGEMIVKEGKDKDSQPSAQVSLYRQLHTGSLHRRGYRGGNVAMHKAALKETLAAGLLLQAGWQQQVKEALKSSSSSSPAVLVDPMMGSGSFLVEGAMIAADIAPGIMRLKCGLVGSNTPPILRWKHDNQNAETLWKNVLLQATTRAKQGLALLKQQHNQGEKKKEIYIVGNDIHEGALELAEHALTLAGLTSVVQIPMDQGYDCRDWKPSNNHVPNDTPWLVVCNPPWGLRLDENMQDSWESLRVFLRDGTCPGGTQAWVLSGSKEATKHLGLRRSQSIPLKTGQVDLRFLQYVIRDSNEVPPERNEKGDEKGINNNYNINRQDQKQPRQQQQKPIVAQRRFRRETTLQNDEKYSHYDSPRPSYTNGARQRRPQQQSGPGRGGGANQEIKSKPKKVAVQIKPEDNEWLI